MEVRKSKVGIGLWDIYDYMLSWGLIPPSRGFTSGFSKVHENNWWSWLKIYNWRSCKPQPWLPIITLPRYEFMIRSPCEVSFKRARFLIHRGYNSFTFPWTMYHIFLHSYFCHLKNYYYSFFSGYEMVLISSFLMTNNVKRLLDHLYIFLSEMSIQALWFPLSHFFGNFLWFNLCNIKCIILTILKVQVSGISYLHSIVQSSLCPILNRVCLLLSG